MFNREVSLEFAMCLRCICDDKGCIFRGSFDENDDSSSLEGFQVCVQQGVVAGVASLQHFGVRPSV
jgi:hypothetical protein